MENIRCPSIIDLEASGFGTESYPIEVGVAHTSGERYCALIKPATSWRHWSHHAETVHGISRSLLIDKGLSPGLICDELNRFIGGGSVFSDAFTHDQHWLSKLYAIAKKRPTFQLRAIEHIMHETQVLIWDATKLRLQKSLKLERHRASSDAFLVQQTYLQSKLQMNVGLEI